MITNYKLQQRKCLQETDIPSYFTKSVNLFKLMEGVTSGRHKTSPYHKVKFSYNERKNLKIQYYCTQDVRFHSNVAEDPSLLGCYATPTGNSLQLI